MLELRWYQREAIDAFYKYFEDGNDGNPLIVAPTGAGKSVIIAQLVKEILEKWPDQRIIVTTHVKELIEQNHAEFVALCPEIEAGIYSAGVGRRDLRQQVIFAGIQSIYNKVFQLWHTDLMLVDEAHTIPKEKKKKIKFDKEGRIIEPPAKKPPRWRYFITEMLKMNPYFKIAGLTATEYRLDSGLLHKGENRIFTDVCYTIPITTLIDEGHLCEIVPAPVETTFDVSQVKKDSNGDFSERALQAAIDVDHITKAAVAEIVKHGVDRKSWLVFSSGNKHAAHIRDEIRSHGISCEMITDKTPKKERERIIEAFKKFEIRCLVNNMVLTTGFNARGIDLIAVMRPTHSPGLWVQMLGRGMRTWFTKINCLILDFARNIDRHGPIDEIRPPAEKGDGDGEAPIKNCPECDAIIHAAARRCPDCGYIFPDPELKITAKASTKALLSKQIVPEWVDVTNVYYSKHTKTQGFNMETGKAIETYSLLVEYQCGMSFYKEWVSLEATGGARWNAEQWWKKRSSIPAPRKVDDALTIINEITKPAKIQVKKNGKYFDIVNVDFSGALL
jgi:DNA repair protein RadD